MSDQDLSYIEPDLRPLATPIDEMVPDPHQAQEHDGRSLREIERSLCEHGQKKPVVVERSTGYLKAGNGTLEAARRLGWTHLAAVHSSDVEEDLRVYALRDNRTAQFARWIGEKVVEELVALPVEPDDAGWSSNELASLERVSSMDIEPPSPADLDAAVLRSYDAAASASASALPAKETEGGSSDGDVAGNQDKQKNDSPDEIPLDDSDYGNHAPTNVYFSVQVPVEAEEHFRKLFADVLAPLGAMLRQVK